MSGLKNMCNDFVGFTGFQYYWFCRIGAFFKKLQRTAPSSALLFECPRLTKQDLEHIPCLLFCLLLAAERFTYCAFPFTVAIADAIPAGKLVLGKIKQGHGCPKLTRYF